MGISFIDELFMPYADLIMQGVIMTMVLSFKAIVAGSILALVVAWFRTQGSAIVRPLAQSYVELIRNTPLLVQLLIVFFGLPSIGIRLSAPDAAFLALTINLSGYVAEILRAGIESIHRSQIEAGLALGMRDRQIFRHVVLMPALKAIYPALSSQFILLMLMTSIVSTIGVDELFHQAVFVESRTFQSFEVYTGITLAYLVLTIALRAVFRAVYWLAFERRSST